ncbi:MAG TPA: Sjogren's syndrome/scleroderma autoantigen 1 family protein [Nitrososphaera sp.]|jgi:uncharacterized Zn finger protein (UPF0148 family)|nr:Sjogren's syndrome/scleroderma autoantigen 1 family protein [Nitrososphaera sp.]
MASSDENVSRIKTGASLLANGGTLTSEPCTRCSGVQVRLGDKTTCINCGNEVNTTTASPHLRPERERQEEEATPARRSEVLASTLSIIEGKIARLNSEIRIEDDISIQGQKAELLERYLGILEKVKRLME